MKTLGLWCVLAVAFAFTACAPDTPPPFQPDENEPVYISELGVYDSPEVVPEMVNQIHEWLGTKPDDQEFEENPFAGALASLAGGSCVTLTFTPTTFATSVVEEGIRYTSLFPISPHVHQLGGQLGNHGSCCSPPYEFERTDALTFTVKSLDISPWFGGQSNNFVSSSGAVLTPPVSGTVTFPALGWTAITSFRWNHFSGGTFIDNLEICPGIIPVDIDIKPGSDPNSINLGSKGRIPVAILTTDDFDAADVDPATVTLGDDDGSDTPVAARKNGTLYASLEDVDDDGDLDLILHFDTQALVGNGDLDASTTELILNGENTGGQQIQGSDSVNIVP